MLNELETASQGEWLRANGIERCERREEERRGERVRLNRTSQSESESFGRKEWRCDESAMQNGRIWGAI